MATWHIEGTTAVEPNLSHLATKAATAALYPRIETKMHAVCWAQCILFWVAPVPLNYILCSLYVQDSIWAYAN